MADLLADQGDYEGALGIYEELVDQVSEREGAELEALIEKMRIKLKKGPGKPAKAEDVPAVDVEDIELDEAIVIDGDVAVVPEEDIELEADFEPSGGAQPMGIPDIEDEEVGAFDAQAVLNEMLGVGDDEESEDADPFAAEVAAAQEPDFDELADIDVDSLLSEDEMLDLGDAQEGEAEAEPETEAEAEAETAEPATVEEAVSNGMPGKDNLMKTLEALADRLEARAAT